MFSLLENLDVRLSNIEMMLESLTARLTALNEQGNASEELLNAKQAANYLSLALPTLYGLVQRREIPHSRPGGKKLYFRKDELTDWMQKNRRKTKAEIQAEVRKGVRRG